MVELSRSIRYIELHSSLQEQARLAWQLDRMPPHQAVISELAAMQNPDGGFAHARLPSAPSTVDATLTALWQLDELGLLASEITGNALTYLTDTQRQDGGWDENPLPAPFIFPPWIEPGSPATRNYLTAYAAYWLGLARGAETPVFQQALAYLLDQQEGSGELPGYLHSCWLGAAVFALAGRTATAATARALDYLQVRLAGDWQASQLAWALDCLLRAGVAVDEPFCTQALHMLGERQRTDGSFASEDGDAFATSATLQALKVFKAAGMG